jgi:hypothetical protein
MQSSHFAKAGLLMLLLVIAFFASWEIYLRSKRGGIDYDDGKELWSYQRARIYAPSEKATVFIGSSRIKFDLDIATWEKLTGEQVIQLAKQGSSPLPILDNLAADDKFKGKLIVDVTEGLFFSGNPANLSEPSSFVAYYKKETPAEKASFELNRGLESGFAFLDRENYSINAFLEKLQLQNRPGVFSFPIFPMEFDRNSFGRQSYMTDKFLADTNLQNQVKGIWKFFASINKNAPPSGKMLDSFMVTVKNDVDRIKARGGQVMFVRTPSSGPYWEGEQHGFPREKYWDRLLSFTNTPGIHFKDYPAIDHFVCPEFSHLAPKDAVTYTQNLVAALEGKGWHFANKKNIAFR